MSSMHVVTYQVVLSLIDVGAHGNNARDTSRVGLARTSRRCVHDRVLGRSQEIGTATQTVEHARSQNASAVGVSVDIDLDGSVHADNTKTTDDLGRV